MININNKKNVKQQSKLSLKSKKLILISKLESMNMLTNDLRNTIFALKTLKQLKSISRKYLQRYGYNTLFSIEKLIRNKEKIFTNVFDSCLLDQQIHMVEHYILKERNAVKHKNNEKFQKFIRKVLDLISDKYKYVINEKIDNVDSLNEYNADLYVSKLETYNALKQMIFDKYYVDNAKKIHVETLEHKEKLEIDLMMLNDYKILWNEYLDVKDMTNIEKRQRNLNSIRYKELVLKARKRIIEYANDTKNAIDMYNEIFPKRSNAKISKLLKGKYNKILNDFNASIYALKYDSDKTNEFNNNSVHFNLMDDKTNEYSVNKLNSVITLKCEIENKDKLLKKLKNLRYKCPFTNKMVDRYINILSHYEINEIVKTTKDVRKDGLIETMETYKQVKYYVINYTYHVNLKHEHYYHLLLKRLVNKFWNDRNVKMMDLSEMIDVNMEIPYHDKDKTQYQRLNNYNKVFNLKDPKRWEIKPFHANNMKLKLFEVFLPLNKSIRFKNWYVQFLQSCSHLGQQEKSYYKRHENYDRKFEYKRLVGKLGNIQLIYNKRDEITRKFRNFLVFMNMDLNDNFIDDMVDKYNEKHYCKVLHEVILKDDNFTQRSVEMIHEQIDALEQGIYNLGKNITDKKEMKKMINDTMNELNKLEHGNTRHMKMLKAKKNEIRNEMRTMRYEIVESLIKIDDYMEYCNKVYYEKTLVENASIVKLFSELIEKFITVKSCRIVNTQRSVKEILNYMVNFMVKDHYVVIRDKNEEISEVSVNEIDDYWHKFDFLTQKTPKVSVRKYPKHRIYNVKDFLKCFIKIASHMDDKNATFSEAIFRILALYWNGFKTFEQDILQ